MTVGDWALLFLLSLLWGGSFFFAAVAVRELPPMTVVAARTGIAALVLLLVLRITGEAWPIRRDLVPTFAIMGLLNNLVPFSLLFWAQTMIPSGLASILNATTPIFTIIIAHFVLADERMAMNKAIGIALGVMGVVVLVGGNFLDTKGFAITGILACLGAALSYGMAGTYGRRFKPMGLSAVQVALGQLAATTIMMIPLTAIIDRPWTLPLPSTAAITAVIALAVVSTALGYLIFFRILASAGAVNAALVTLLIPASAIMLGTVFLGETLAPRHYIGMCFIGAGLLTIDGRLFRKIPR